MLLSRTPRPRRGWWAFDSHGLVTSRYQLDPPGSSGVGTIGFRTPITFSFYAGIGWSLAGGYEPFLDLRCPESLIAFLACLGPHSILPTVEVNRSFTGVTP